MNGMDRSQQGEMGSLVDRSGAGTVYNTCLSLFLLFVSEQHHPSLKALHLSALKM